MDVRSLPVPGKRDAWQKLLVLRRGPERQCSLPEQNAGNWVDVATGKAYRADAIPNNAAATYRVQRSLPESDFTVDVSDAVYSGEAP